MAEKTGNTEFYGYDFDNNFNASTGKGSVRVIKMTDTEFKDERGTWWELEFEDVETAQTDTYDDYYDLVQEVKETYKNPEKERDADGYLIQK